jgi:hypothetical protein
MFVVLLFASSISGFHPNLVSIIQGRWTIDCHEVDPLIDRDAHYSDRVLFQSAKSSTALTGELLEVHPNGVLDRITFIRLEVLSEVDLVVYTGSPNYYYRLIDMKFNLSRDAVMIAVGQFVDKTGQYTATIYNGSVAEVTTFEKEKVSSFWLERCGLERPWHAWMGSYFYFLPVTVVLLVMLLMTVPAELPWFPKLKTE